MVNQNAMAATEFAAQLANEVIELRAEVKRLQGQMLNIMATLNKDEYTAACHCGKNPGGLCGECWLNPPMLSEPIIREYSKKVVYKSGEGMIGKQVEDKHTSGEGEA